MSYEFSEYYLLVSSTTKELKCPKIIDVRLSECAIRKRPPQIKFKKKRQNSLKKSTLIHKSE